MNKWQYVRFSKQLAVETYKLEKATSNIMLSRSDEKV